jgi:hypothetical protein
MFDQRITTKGWWPGRPNIASFASGDFQGKSVAAGQTKRQKKLL